MPSRSVSFAVKSVSFAVHCTFLTGIAILSGNSIVRGGGFDFGRDVLPVLSDRCFHCHGPDEATRESGLRLDVRSEAVDWLGESADDSDLINRVTSDDPDTRMPPPESGPALTTEEIAILKSWVDAGSPYRKHWAFVPPRVDPTLDPLHGRQLIDHLVNRGLADTRLRPAGRADRWTLARRTALVLTGLQLDAERLNQYVADPRPDELAHADLVDDLLADPGYGVHRARYWLDAVRYGDTHGMARDDERSIWPYRDWVVDAFNANLSFDAFSLRQLAGDRLPDPATADLVATGMNRCNISTAEGGSIDEELLVGYASDRVDTLSTVWLGMTIACAKCHDHKFDPITQADYYRLMALFNNIDEEPINGNAFAPSPIVAVPDDDQQRRLAKLNARQTRWTRDRRSAIESAGDSPAYAAFLDKVRERELPFAPERALGDLTWHRVGPIGQPNNTAIAEDHPLGPESGFDSDTEYGEGVHWETCRATNDAIKVFGDNAAFFHHVRVDLPWPITLPIRLASDESLWKPVRFRIWVDGEVTFDRSYRQHEVPFEQTIELPLAAGQSEILVQVAAFGGPLRAEFGVDRAAMMETLRRLETIRNGNSADVREHFVDHHAPGWADRRRQWRDLAARRCQLEREIPVTMIARERARRRPTHVLIRGEYDNLGERVGPGVPAALCDGEAKVPPDIRDRLDLANWLIAADHPLTARVAVNRFWQQCFARGIVATSDDFGLQGARPSHPRLLDALAVGFVRSGWDVKAMFREICNSDTFCRSSVVAERQRLIDPENRFLARGPRVRMDAEVIRDTRLQAAGLLDRSLGGRGVKPPQPTGLWSVVSQPNSTTARFFADPPDRHHRRSLYLFWKRTSPPPAMQTFDAPMRDACVVDRGRTNTPLQALALMNEFQNVQAATAMADRILNLAESPDPADTRRQRLVAVFRAATGRPPRDEERATLNEMLDDLARLYALDPKAAQDLIDAAELNSRLSATASISDRAAWTMLCSTLLNLSESVTVP